MGDVVGRPIAGCPSMFPLSRRRAAAGPQTCARRSTVSRGLAEEHAQRYSNPLIGSHATDSLR